MNCKPGDLARTVNIVPLLENGNDRIVKLRNEPPLPGEFWRLEEPVSFVVAGLCHSLQGQMFFPGDIARFDVIHDNCLRPIRGLPGGDETLLWAGKPVDQGVPA
jgi:hypothetical protein